MHAPLDFAALWHDTLATARHDLPVYLSLTAAFVLLPEVAISLFGPKPPATPEDLTIGMIAVRLLLPAMIGAIAQMTIVILVADAARGGAPTVGAALRLALIGLPTLVLALLLTGIPVAIGLFMLIVPGLYILARLAMVLPLVAVDHAGPVEALRRSWAMTEHNGFRVLGFMAVWFALSVAAAILVGGLALAVDSVFTVAGAKGLAKLAGAVLNGAVAAVFSVYSAVATATIYLHLTRPG